MSTQRQPYEWTCLTDSAAFAARDGAGLLSFKGRLWLLGGWNPLDKEHFPQICNSEVWVSDDGRAWELVTHAPWEGRHTAGYAVHEGRMWIVGGDANQGHYQSDVWCSEDGEHWELVTDDVPWGPRVLHHTVVHDGFIWLMGGQTLPQFAPAEEVFYSDVRRSADGATWEKVTEGVPWAPRGMIGGSAVFQGRIWILGGGTYDTPDHPDRIFYNDVWSSADGVHWQQHVEAAPWAARQYHEVAAWDGRLWVLEGSDGANRNDVWYSEDGVTWTELPDTPWAPRHAASVVVHDGALWVIAGNNMRPDVWRLDRK
ncbi:MAG: galactose oxidase [Armatimonadota bacterium]|nr:galactose oxidase [Armatimonadota bacterium]